MKAAQSLSQGFSYPEMDYIASLFPGAMENAPEGVHGFRPGQSVQQLLHRCRRNEGDAGAGQSPGRLLQAMPKTRDASKLLPQSIHLIVLHRRCFSTKGKIVFFIHFFQSRGSFHHAKFMESQNFLPSICPVFQVEP